MHPQHTYTEEFCVRTFHIDQHKRMRIPHLINLMQEAAMQNVIELGVSVWDLEKHHVSWVLMRMHLRIFRIPKLGERIRIVTRPAGFEKFFVYRDYRIYDAADQVVAEAPSTWLLMDTNTRRMTRIPPFILAYEMPAEADCLPRIRHKLPHFEMTSGQQTFAVEWHDLDFNKHLSNMLYIKWMLDSLDHQHLNSTQLESLDIFYRMECRAGERVDAAFQQVDDFTYLHRLSRQSDGKEVASAQSKWKLFE